MRLLSYVKQIAGPGLMHEARCSGLVHWDDDPAEWDREGGGGGFGTGNTCVPVADSQCMAKTTTIL